MKAILPALLAPLLLGSPCPAAGKPPAPPPEYTEPFVHPKGDMNQLLSIASGIAGKPVVVADGKVLELRMPFVLPAPVSAGTVRRTIDAVLLLEGYALVDAGEELHLKRILTEEQCAVFNKSLGKPRAGSEPLAMLMNGDRPYKDHVIIRPAPGH